MTDLVFLHLIAGNGGQGRVSFRREKFIAKGGPDGGDGARGGDIIIRGDKKINTLREFAGKTGFAAPHGGAGGKKQMSGAKGENVVLEVPVGTTVWQISENIQAHKRRVYLGGLPKTFKRDQIHKERYELFKEGEFIPERPNDDLMDQDVANEIRKEKKFEPEKLHLIKLVDILEDGQEIVIAQGGIGGRGNEQFKSSSLTTPLIAEYGSYGEQRMVAFELKLLADVGLVGFPNAGKSTLVSRLTSARPKVAAYPFTTLEPHLGIYHSARTGKELVIADIPGLIEGANEGKGLGFQFLRHIENCKVLLYILAMDESVVQDESMTEEEKCKHLWNQYKVLQKEVSDYRDTLIEKPAHVIVNKIDLFPEGLLKKVVAFFKKKKVTILPISGATGAGIDELDILLSEFS